MRRSIPVSTLLHTRRLAKQVFIIAHDRDGAIGTVAQTIQGRMKLMRSSSVKFGGLGPQGWSVWDDREMDVRALEHGDVDGAT